MAFRATKNRHHRSKIRSVKRAIEPEEAIGALKVARSNLIGRIAELEKATPAHQTWGDLIVKDVLIVSSVLFWPAVIYWFW